MGRMIPLGDDPLIHPVLSLSFFAAGMAATLAIITGLCGVRFRRRSSRKPSPSPTLEATEKSGMVTPPLATANIETTMVPPLPQITRAEDSEDTTDNNASQIKELPPPPAMKTLRETYSCNYMIKSASTRKLDSSLSIKFPRSMSVKTRTQEEKHQRKKGKLNSENSLCSKPIILGEKCKVPDEDDAIIYDSKGNRISTYHKKTTSSMSLSRQTSYIDLSASPSLDKNKGGTRKEGQDCVDDVCYQEVR